MDVAGDADFAVVEPDIGQIFDLGLGIGGAPGGDPGRARTQQEVQDRDVVGCQIPDDVDILLIQSKIEPRRVNVIHFTQVASIEAPAEFADSRIELEGVADHEDAARLGGFDDERTGLGRRGSERLFHQHVLTGSQRLQRQRAVAARRGCDDHRIDVGQG